MMRRRWLTGWALIGGIVAWLIAVPPQPAAADAMPLMELQRVDVVGRPGDVQRFSFRTSAPWIDLRLDKEGGITSLRLLDAEATTLLWPQHPGVRYGTESLIWKAEKGADSGAEGSAYIAEVHFQSAGKVRLTLETFAEPRGDVRRRLGARRLSALAADAFRQGTEASRRRSLALYGKALEAWQSLGDGPQQGRCLLARAILYQRLGDDATAAATVDLAIDVFRRLDDAHGLAMGLNLAGVLARGAGESDRAASLYSQALDSHRRVGDPCGEARAQLNLGLLAQHRGDAVSAGKRYADALERCPVAEDPQFGAELLVDLAGVHETLGELSLAITTLERSLPLLRQQGKLSHLAVALGNLGTYQRRLGNYDKAFDAYHQALDVARQLGDLRRQATVLNSLGFAYLRLGEPQRALAFLNEALPLRRESRQRRGEAITLSNLGRAYAEVGQRQLARQHHQRSLALRQDIGDQRGADTTRVALAEMDLEEGDGDRAAQRLLAVRENKRQTGDRLGEAQVSVLLAQARLTRPREPGDGQDLVADRDDLVRARGILAELGDREFEARAAQAMGQMERRLGRLREAESSLHEAIDLLETVRSEIGDSDLRSSFLGQQRQVYELAIEVTAELHAADPEAGWERRGLELSERIRARSLLDMVSRSERRRLQDLQPELYGKRQAALGQLRDLDRRMERADAQLQRRLRGRLQQTLSELDRIDAELRQAGSGQAADGLSTVLTVDGMQGLLDAESLVLQFFSTAETTYLWTVDGKRIEMHALAGNEALEPLVMDLLESWRRLELRDDRGERAQALQLSDLLLAPIADRLQGFERLVIVPDGVLHYLPIAALVDPRAEGPLIGRYEVVQVPSLSVLASLRRRRLDTQASRGAEGDGHRILVVADPVFTEDDPRLQVHRSAGPAQTGEAQGDGSSAEDDGRPQNRSLAAGQAGGALPRLPGSGDEARALADLAPASRLLLGLQASRARLLSGALGEVDILHFATHGRIDDQTPRLSGLSLSRFDEGGRPVEGHLSLDDIYGLRLGADLVVLSGCQTALGKAVDGEGLLGLTRGFMHAGASRVVATLWSVQDRASQQLMERYYRHLLAGDAAPAEALRRAQNELRQIPRWRDPYFWAAFVHQGDWRR